MNKRTIIIIVTLALLALLVYILTSEPETEEDKSIRLDKARREAYAYAVKCSGVTPELQYKDITWIVIPGNKIRYNAIDGHIDLAGYFSPSDSVIYVASLYDDTFWVLAHESMHAIGFRGHPEEPFERCKLLAKQN
jgi:hypothetical protein